MMKIIDFKAISNSIDYMVHLILNAKSLMWKNSGNVFLGHLGESSSYFPNTALGHGVPPNSF